VGTFGGKSGASARSYLNKGTPKEQRIPSKFIGTMRRGDVFRGEMAASGGYGDPLERDPAAVLEDVRQEKMSVRHAMEEYGVVILGETLRLDLEATRRERDKRRRAQE
jgi:N-methylhydantoinase B